MFSWIQDFIVQRTMEDLTSFEKDFCGGPIWDLNRTWDTENPDFTPCFHKTVLAWFPSVILLLFSFNEFRLFKASVNRTIPINFLNLSKILLTCLLIILSVTEFIFTIVTENDENSLTEIFPVDYVTCTLYFISYCW